MTNDPLHKLRWDRNGSTVRPPSQNLILWVGTTKVSGSFDVRGSRRRALHKTSLFAANLYSASALRAEKHITRSLLKKSTIHNKSLGGEYLRHPPCVLWNKLLSLVSKRALHKTGLFVAYPYAASALRAQPVAASARGGFIGTKSQCDGTVVRTLF